MNEKERVEWLYSLKVSQVRALACQKGLADWLTGAIPTLVTALSKIDHVEVPLSTLGVE